VLSFGVRRKRREGEVWEEKWEEKEEIFLPFLGEYFGR
jgi:hypothetical protein